MLGFSPLASAPLANTGAVAEAAFGLDDIVRSGLVRNYLVTKLALSL